MRKQFLFLVLMSLSVAAVAEDTISFSGRFEQRTDEMSLAILGRQVCFYPDAATESRTPRDKKDKRMVWFCFSNTAAAVKAFAIPTNKTKGECGLAGTASVTVSKYVVYRGEGDGNDQAQLINASSVSPPLAIACE